MKPAPEELRTKILTAIKQQVEKGPTQDFFRRMLDFPAGQTTFRNCFPGYVEIYIDPSNEYPEGYNHHFQWDPLNLNHSQIALSIQKYHALTRK